MEKKLVSKNKNTDTFYTKTEGLDYIRFPLIKPFDIVCLNNQNIWSMGEGFENTIAYNTLKLSFKENLLIGYCGEGTIVNYQELKESWFVINLKNNPVNQSFSEEIEFQNFLKKLNIDSQKLQWKTTNELFKQFEQTGCLPWIPTCE